MYSYLEQTGCSGMGRAQLARDGEKWKTSGFHKMRGISWLAEEPFALSRRQFVSVRTWFC